MINFVKKLTIFLLFVVFVVFGFSKNSNLFFIGYSPTIPRMFVGITAGFFNIYNYKLGVYSGMSVYGSLPSADYPSENINSINEKSFCFKSDFSIGLNYEIKNFGTGILYSYAGMDFENTKNETVFLYSDNKLYKKNENSEWIAGPDIGVLFSLNPSWVFSVGYNFALKGVKIGLYVVADYSS